MKLVFLIAALALPDAKKENYKILVQFLHHYYPGYSVVLGKGSQRPSGAKSTPLIFDGQRVWLKHSA